MSDETKKPDSSISLSGMRDRSEAPTPPYWTSGQTFNSVAEEVDAIHRQWGSYMSNDERHDFAVMVGRDCEKRLEITHDPELEAAFLEAIGERRKRRTTVRSAAARKEKEKLWQSHVTLTMRLARLLRSDLCLTDKVNRVVTEIAQVSWLREPQVSGPGSTKWKNLFALSPRWFDPPPASKALFWALHQKVRKSELLGQLSKWRNERGLLTEEVCNWVTGLQLSEIHQALSGASLPDMMEQMEAHRDPTTAMEEEIEEVGLAFRRAYDGFTETHSIAHITDKDAWADEKQRRVEKCKVGVRDFLSGMSKSRTSTTVAEEWDKFASGESVFESWKLLYGDGSRAMGAHIFVESIYSELTAPNSDFRAAMEEVLEKEEEEKERGSESGW